MIIKTKKGKSSNYTVIPNAILTDERLSYKARGVLNYLLSKPDNWTVRVQDIANRAPDMGVSAVRSALKELQTIGYASLEQIRLNGKAQGKEWVVYEEPLTCRKPESQKIRKSENLKVKKPPCIVSTDYLVSTEKIESKQKTVVSVFENIKSLSPKYLEALKDFEEHRKEIKSKMTVRAGQMLVKSLEDLTDSERIERLNLAVLNGWKGVYASKEKTTTTAKQPKKQPTPDAVSIYG